MDAHHWETCFFRHGVAGHSVPTGSNRWADDRKFLEEDKKRPAAVAATQSDAQGPHEAPIRAGEERVLPWPTTLKPGPYTLKARLIYDPNRYNDRSFKEDQTEIRRTTLAVTLK